MQVAVDIRKELMQLDTLTSIPNMSCRRHGYVGYCEIGAPTESPFLSE